MGRAARPHAGAGSGPFRDPIAGFELFKRSRYAGNRVFPLTELAVPYQTPGMICPNSSNSCPPRSASSSSSPSRWPSNRWASGSSTPSPIRRPRWRTSHEQHRFLRPARRHHRRRSCGDVADRAPADGRHGTRAAGARTRRCAHLPESAAQCVRRQHRIDRRRGSRRGHPDGADRLRGPAQARVPPAADVGRTGSDSMPDRVAPESNGSSKRYRSKSRFPTVFSVPIDPQSGDLTTGTFVSGSADTYAIDLRATAPSLLRAHVKLLCSEERDFVLDSRHPYRWALPVLGLPCAGAHDLGLTSIRTPHPSMDARARRRWNGCANGLDSPPGGGGITVTHRRPLRVGSRLSDRHPPNPTKDVRRHEFVGPVLEDLVPWPPPSPPCPSRSTSPPACAAASRSTRTPAAIFRLGDKPVVVALAMKGSGARAGRRPIPHRSTGADPELRERDITGDPQTAFLDMAISDDPPALG